MFKFIRKLFFGKKELLPPSPQKSNESIIKQVPKTKIKSVIPYNPELIEGLQEDHKALLTIYSKIMEHAKAKQYAELTFGLDGFDELLKSHLRKESHELYMYLEFVVAKDEGNEDRKMFRDFRLEMKEIAVTVRGFVNQYTNIPVTNTTVDQFIADFTQLGGVLVERINREEKNLYLIYNRYNS